MTLPSQQYALLANDAYVDRAVGVRPAGARERIKNRGQSLRFPHVFTGVETSAPRRPVAVI